MDSELVDSGVGGVGVGWIGVRVGVWGWAYPGYPLG